ncbi:MAG: hypothetical protein GDA35_04755 [Hyphomonadaceae bacterium]|nr:hypothetical protein [Hyphomonadaceae bacterium]
MTEDQDDEFESSWIMESKLEPNKPKISLVERERLLKPLSDALDRKIGLIVAPAGFGKSTLLCQWFTALKDAGHTAAWLTLDESDADERQFLSYIAIALSHAGLDIGELEIGARNGFSDTPTVRVLNTLMKEVQCHGPDTVLLLDDYHLVSGSGIDELIKSILKIMPSNLTLVVNSRTMPQVDVPMLVATGEALEIGADQIRLTLQETVSVLGDDFSDKEAKDIFRQTEGWPVAVQLARVQKQARPSQPIRLAAPSGFVAAYLTSQLLSSLDNDVREFLLVVSCLDRFNSELADHIRDASDSGQLIGRLQPLTALIISIDYEGDWYRLHHLFAEYLRDTLHKESAARLIEIQLKASAWYDEQGLLIEAVKYAVAAGNFQECERLILAAGGWKIILTQGISVIRALFRLVPKTTVSSSARLLVARAYLHCKDGEYTSARGLLDASVVLRTEEDGAAYDTDHIIIESMVNAYEDKRDWALSPNNESKLKTAADLDALEAAMLASEQIMVSFALGDFARADESVKSAFSFFRRSDSVLGLNYCYLHAATSALHRAEMDLARANVNQALELAASNFGSDSGLKHLAQVIDYALKIWHGKAGPDDLEAFSQTLAHIEEYDGWTEIYLLGLDAAYHLCEQCGEFAFAEDIAARFLSVAKSRQLDRLKLYCQIFQVRVAARLGQKSEAGKLIERIDDWMVNAAPQNEPRVWHAYFLAAETRAATRLTSPSRTIETLRQSIRHADTGGLALHQIRLRVAKAIALRQLNRRDLGTEYLAEAIRIAANRKLMGPFLCDDALKRLLKEVRTALRNQDDELILMSFVTDTINRGDVLRPRIGGDILSVREHEILEQLALGLSNKEIARRFQLTENTIKFHLKNLYRKLDVSRRTQAIAVARRRKLVV